ncbi:NAD(P)-binding protein [Nocardia sp. ET3-3]|uniref:NAD(P)-binding protein n=1 Tax=Nocardia terrae TaxID=2675851 RepID=A0A7K1UQ94_9NOCA|nr:FAD-dependent monooxygenase [Nocardia terrae]MVU76068.1 NAD(P)-binding protein [Nocardia terrae]
MATILGGGIAGSVLAGALARQGSRVTLYEQQAAGPGGGAFLFIDGRGHDALHALGVDDAAIEAASYAVSALHYEDSKGRGSSMSRGHRFWMRSKLMAILTDFVAGSGADLRYGLPITDIALTGPGRATLHRGGENLSVTDDILIAADGIDSVVRAALEPDRVPVYANDVVLYGMTAEPVELASDPEVLHFFAEVGPGGAPGATFGHIHRDGDNPMWFIRIAREALSGADDLGMRPMAEWADAVRAAAPSIPDLVTSLIDHTGEVHVSNARNVPIDKAAAPVAHTLLIGDADHAISPAAGVGARDALEDAHAVFQALTAGASPADAMARRRIQILDDRERAMRGRAAISRRP